jgi:sec-independent protein translocase protein TatA
MIPGLPQVGLMELVIVLSIIMLFFGATRIPQLGRSLGRGIREFRKGAAEADDKDEVQDGRQEGRGETVPERGSS